MGNNSPYKKGFETLPENIIGKLILYNFSKILYKM
jgi:hypothetical protein